MTTVRGDVRALSLVQVELDLEVDPVERPSRYLEAS